MILKGKNIIVTGASGGIGRHIALALAKKGANPILVGRNAATLSEVQKACENEGVRVKVINQDLSDPVACQIIIEDAFECCGTVDALINNAGVQQFSLLESTTDAYITQSLNTNVMAVMRLTRAIAPFFLKQNSGHIVNIGSTFGSIGYPGFSVYTAAKFAVRGFSEAMRRELADTNIKISYIAPRATKTTMNSDAVFEMNEALSVGMDDPGWVAEQVIQTLISKEKNVYLGWPEKLFVKINHILPSIVDKALLKKLPIIKSFAKKNRAA